MRSPLPNSKKRKSYFFLKPVYPFSLIYLSLLFCLFSCSKQKTKKMPRIYPVHVETVQKKDVPIYIDTFGHVEPIVTVNVVSRVKGEITGVYFTEGQTVKEGDLLFTIDPRTFEAILEKNKGVLQESLAKLAFAKEKVERYATLTQEEYYSQVDFDQLKTNAAALEGFVQQANGDVMDAQVNLDYCWIYSPLNGRTGILQIDQGNTLKGDESQTLVTINQMKPIYVTFFVPEKDVPRIRHYMKENGALQTIAAYEDFKVNPQTGALQMLNNQVDERTGMIKLRSVFANTHEELWPKEFVKVRLILFHRKDAVIIPYEAIDITTRGKFVYVVKSDHTVEQRKVELGQREDDNIIVLSGLKEGEIVVTEGMQNLKPGSHVEIKNNKT